MKDTLGEAKKRAFNVLADTEVSAAKPSSFQDWTPRLGNHKDSSCQLWSRVTNWCQPS